MKPLSDKQAQAISKLYPQLVWDEIRNLSAQEASQMISEKWGDSKPRNSAGWRTEPQMSKSLPITPVKASDEARDRLIVRQTCLKCAVELAHNIGTDQTLNPKLAEDVQGVLKIAGVFEEWVFREGK